MLVLIGRNWANATDDGGRTCLKNPDDYVRLEIEAALKRNIPVTPVLVQRAHMPAAEQLPEEIRDLAYRTGFEIRHNRCQSDVRAMIRRLGLDAPPIAKQSSKSQQWRAWGLVSAFIMRGNRRRDEGQSTTGSAERRRR
jgi:hypothetical protein